MGCTAVQHSKPPLHTSHSYTIPQQYPLHVDTLSEAIFFISSFYGGTVPLNERRIQ